MSAERRARAAVLALCLLGLAAPAEAPPGRYRISIDTVEDLVTGLRWQRTPLPEPKTWADAQVACAGLGLGGLSGWRLPQIRELQSLFDARTGFDARAFPDQPKGSYWSSTRTASNAGFAWVMTFGEGTTGGRAREDPNLVRCVR